MKRLLHAACALLLLALAGCGGQATTRNWTARADLQGEAATLRVDVPGWTLGTDYHPHLSLDGGPVVMMYAPTYTFKHLAPGVHHMQIVLADSHHNPIAGLAKDLTVTVK